MGRYKDLKGLKFGRLTVIGKTPLIKNKKTYWLCECECGNEKYVNAGKLNTGHVKSCGCIRKEYYNRPKSAILKENPRLKNIYGKMKSRCNNHNNKKYPIYGGRGIEICKEWQEDSEAFYQWAIQNGYKNNLTIERIDVNGNYEPSNCRWATYKEQANNTRRNHFIEINGERKTIAQWAEYYGITWYQASKLEKE